MTLLKETIENIRAVDTQNREAIMNHLNNLTKPIGSLGKLEQLALKYSLIRKNVKGEMPTKRIIVFAADHGVVREGVSAYPKEVTVQMVTNMNGGGAAINVLSNLSESSIEVVDVGVDAETTHLENVVHRKVCRGAANIKSNSAMTQEQVLAAIGVGIERAAFAAEAGVTLLGLGEMGIGNTTSAAAIFCALTPCDATEIVGRGTGVDDAGVSRKVQTIKAAFKHNMLDREAPLEVLQKVGGLEIAAMTGAIIAGAANGMAVMIDGFISTAAALVAIRLCPMVSDYLFFSHCSDEKGHALVLEIMNQKPLLDMSLRLGEGTGSALAFGLVDAAMKLYTSMATFESAGVSEC